MSDSDIQCKNSTLSVTEFFDFIFHDVRRDEVIFCSNFDTHPKPGVGWFHNSSPKAAERRTREVAEYFCTATIKNQGTPRRRLEDCVSLWLIVLDDVGEKVETSTLPPTYKIETSKGSFHYGYVFEEPINDMVFAEALVRAVYDKDMGLSDSGGKMPCKMVRMPCGYNLKGGRDNFKVRLAEWKPENLYTPEDLIEAWNLELHPKQPRVAKDIGDVEDIVEGWLLESGLVTADDGGDYVEIVCPWHAEHTTDGDTAGFSPLGRGGAEWTDIRTFSCFHGHCAERDVNDLLDWVVEQGGPSVVSTSVEEVERPRWLLQNMVWLELQGKYWNLEANGMVGHESVNATYLHDMPIDEVVKTDKNGKESITKKRSLPHTFLTNSHDAKRAHDAGWHPGEGEFYTWERQKRINTYYPSEIKPKKGDARPWLKHLHFLVKDKAVEAQILDWMAFLVQKPGEKVNYGLFLGGDHRIGKDLLFQPLVQILGSHNCKTVKPGELESGFTEYLFQTKLLIIEEMHTNPSEQRKIENILKTILASNATNSLTIDMKRIRPFKIPNLISTIVMSNHKDALNISEGNEARYFCVWSEVKRKADDSDAQYYVDLAHWLIANPGVVMDFLLKRDLSGFNPKGNAPRTEFAQEIVEDSRGNIEKLIQEALDAHEGPFIKPLITAKDVCYHLGLDPHRMLNVVSKAMATMGYKAQLCTKKLKGKVHGYRLIALDEQAKRLTPSQKVECYESKRNTIDLPALGAKVLDFPENEGD